MRLKTTIVTAAVAGIVATSAAGDIHPQLQQQLDDAGADEIISTLVYLNHQVNVEQMNAAFRVEKPTRAERHQEVVESLQDLAAATQLELLNEINARAATGTVQRIQPRWIVNAVRVDAAPADILAIAEHPDVYRVYPNYEIELIAPAAVDVDVPGGAGAGGAGAGGGNPTVGVEAVRAPEVWDLGFTGEGILVATLDTGVDGQHPALADRWRGLDPEYAGNPEWAWFDPVTNTDFPEAFGSHGTHTMGTVCGGSPGQAVGVAPGAQWIHAAVIDRVNIKTTVEDAMAAFEWMTDPDGDPQTVFDVPHVCSNSWGLADHHGYVDCDDLFWSFIDASEAAGTMQLFSAGNEGSGGLRRPADRAMSEYLNVAVAAVDANNASWPIAGFSSTGPTFCTEDGTEAIKPDIAAPGVAVVSSVPNDGYSAFDGTSMASPHINGVAALLFQANPDLSIEDAKQIMYDTAFDLGETGKDNLYGYGMVDALAAVQAVVGLYFTYPDGRPELIDPTGETLITVALGGQAEANPATATLHYDAGAGAAQVSLQEIEPGVYQTNFPQVPCGAEISYWFSIETIEGDLVQSPVDAPAESWSALGYSGIITEFQDDFETDTGWDIVNSPGLTDGAWERGVPVGGGDRGDPPTDADGSGQCYLTANQDGDSDVDDGTTTLISPTLDASDPDALIAYHRWYSNTAGADPMNDIFYVDVSDDDGATWHNLETVGPDGSEVTGGWNYREFLVADIADIENSDQFRIRFVASDLNAGSVVEAGVDGVEIRRYFCDEPPCAADITDNDGEVNTADLLALLGGWGTDGPGADIAEPTDVIDTADLLGLLGAWGPCE